VARLLSNALAGTFPSFPLAVMAVTGRFTIAPYDLENVNRVEENTKPMTIIKQIGKCKVFDSILIIIN
jgi:hypothetical protein